MSEEIKKLKEQLEEKNQQLQNMASQTIPLQALQNTLTEGQIKSIMNPKKLIKWNKNDIAMAISLKSVSSKAYNYLRTKRNFPLPSASTLRRWLSSLNLKTGILECVLPQMEVKAAEFSVLEKLCVLSFDEIYLKQTMSIDKKKQKVIGPHRSCQVALLRGLFSKWKQPIFFSYDTALQPETIFDIIGQLYEVGFIVVAVVHDMGPTNMVVWKKLSIGTEENEKCYINHPSNEDLKVFFFADAPHLLKLIRNHFLDSGYILHGKSISTQSVKEVLKFSNEDYKLTPKLTVDHLNVEGVQRQIVKLAAQLLLNTVSCAIQHLKNKNLISAVDWEETTMFIKLCNDWFDIFNTSMKFGKHNGLKAFGLNLEYQNNILNRMSQVMEAIRVKNKKLKQPFQKGEMQNFYINFFIPHMCVFLGLLVSNFSLASLFQYLKEKFDITYILTSRLNQDVLEQLFSNLRSKGGSNDHPNALDFQHRLKWYILGKCNEDILTGNTQINGDDEILSSNFANVIHSDLEQQNAAEKDNDCFEELDTSLFNEFDNEAVGVSGIVIKSKFF